MAKLRRHLDHVTYSFVGKQMRLKAKCRQRGMIRIVIMLFQLDTRILDVFDRAVETVIGSDPLYAVCKIQDRELLGELIENPKLAGFGWIEHGQLDATERIANIQKAAGLSALPVDGQRHAMHRLDDEAVQHGAEYRIIVKAGRKLRMQYGLVRIDSVDHSLIEVGKGMSRPLLKM